MKKRTARLLFVNLFIVSLSIGQQLPDGFPDTERTKLSLNQGWKFHLGNPEAIYYQKNFDDANWKTINVPHTLELTSLTLDGIEDDKTQSVFQRNVGWYRKNIKVSDSRKKVFLEFEGAHQVTDLWINGKHVGQHSVGGYTPFHFDITEFVKRGETNQITLLLDNRRNEVVPPDPGPFDYVKFSGLYRDVYLVETDPLHVTFNWESLNSGVYITAPTVDPVHKNATINIKTAVKNERSAPTSVDLVTRILDKEGVAVLRLTQSKTIAPGEEFQFNQIGSLEDNVHLWDIDNPYLYRVNSVVLVNGKEVDFVENKIGLRKFQQDPERGFMLNNKPIKLIGFNRHQQYPYLGDAVPNSLHYKDMLQFKEFGFNVMRTAHYPQDDAILDACDELGILVYEEAPTWIAVSQNEEWWNNLEKAARAMVRNHRNHPSVVMWGGGVNHRGYVPRLHDAVKQEDPNRLTASQGARWTGWQASGLTDINANMLYGPFLWDRTEPIFAMEGGRGPKALAPYKKDSLMTGLIAWVAHAYYTFHPNHDKADNLIDKTRSGAMTIFRYPRPNFEWYKSELVEKPMVYIENEWKDGVEEIDVFSNGKEVELFLNGTSIAKSRPSQDTVYFGLDHPPFHFKNLKYRPGKLVAKAYFKDGTTIESVKQTPQKPYAIQLSLDTEGRTFVADGSDILVAYAKVIDKNGETVSDTDKLISFSVKGDASIIGDDAAINANPMFTEYGVAPALVKAGSTPGTITVYAKAKGLKTGSATVQLIPNDTNIIRSKAQPVYDFNRERVDIGAADQLLQFGWNAWNGEDEKANTYTLKEFPNSKVHIRPKSEDGIIRWLGEMNVIGKYGFAYGDGILGIDDEGIDLIFENLPKGTYKLNTWHHAPSSNSDSMDPNREKLKSVTVHQLPYETALTVSSEALKNNEDVKVIVTDGKEMQWEEPGTAELLFVSDGKNPVHINFKGDEKKGIWLNAFELSEAKD
ncbi:glycoside hydrolase family 2 protein [Maribacter sp. 2210JD10-5]|uniref:glycoside hydrolase family 2 protein n=1 Tax=Maribacter sp. 2210JD10-5 TaxID=3386272 RepID=UPI0039BD1008